MKISTNWLKEFVELSPPLERIADRLTMAGLEVKKVEPISDPKDVLFDIEVTTNRPDWLSHLGVAREIAAVESQSFKIPQVDESPNRTLPPGWKLNLKEIEGCPYYTAVYLEGIEEAPTPNFIKERLAACGVRSISLLVDITNYVLLETGQPLHAFDADLLKGKEVQIRRARVKEKFVAIDESEFELESGDLVIADGEKSVALAGVMGGKNTEVTDRTRNILLESAFFHPRWVRQTSQRYGISSESSYRFERTVDPDGVDFGRDRAVELFKKYAKPRFISGVLRAGQKPFSNRSPIHLSVSHIEKCLGIPLKAHQAVSILTRLGLDVKKESQEILNVRVPSFRLDLTRPIDLIEEIARIYGYDQIPETLPAREPLYVGGKRKFVLNQKTREFFISCGFSEAVTFSLISAQGLNREEDLRNAVSIINPQNRELCWMRPLLITSLLSVIRKNHHNGARRIAIYEMANTYHQISGQTHPCEEETLGMAVLGKWREKSWLDPERDVSFYDLKGIIKAYLERVGIHRYRTEPVQKSFLAESNAEKILVENDELGYVGELDSRIGRLWDIDSRIFVAELSLEKILPNACWIHPLEELPRFPVIERDLSITLSETVKAGDIEAEIRRHSPELIRKVELLDLFRGGRVRRGYKNLAFRITFQSLERTLVSEEIQKLHSEIAVSIVQRYQATFQSDKI